MKMIPTIYKGDDTDFRGAARLSLRIGTDADLSGCTVEFTFLGQTRRFSGDAAAKPLSFAFSASETALFPVGVHRARVRVFDSEGRVKTVDDSVRIRVTDSVADAYGTDGEQQIPVSLVSGFTMPEIPASLDVDGEDSGSVFKAKFNDLLARLRSVSALAVAVLLPFAASAAKVETASLDDIPGTDEVVTSVDFDGLATTNDTGAISRSVNALWQYTFGDRTWIAVTNYMRTAEGVVPSLQLWEVRDGATNCVYSSGEEIAHIVSNEVGRIALVFSNLLEGVRAQIPATAWSAYQSGSGAPNPASNEVTVVSTPSVMLTGGAEWQQYVDVSSNSLWVLSSKGVTIAGSDTNGYFRIYDAEGNAAFEVVKEKAVTVPAIPQGNMRPPGDAGTMSVTFIAKTQPILWLSPTLSPPAFVEASEDPNASVSWTDNKNGTWTAAIDFVNVYDMYFAYATYVEPGTTVVKNNAPMRVDGGIVTSDGKKIKPVVSGSAVSWEVVAE